MKWGPWSDWSSCSRLCDAGVRRRSRSCLNGNECVGKKKEESGCMLQKCPGELNECYLAPDINLGLAIDTNLTT